MMKNKFQIQPILDWVIVDWTFYLDAKLFVMTKTTTEKYQFSKKTTTFCSPTSDSGATNLLPTGISFIYIESSSGCHGCGVFASFYRSDIIQIFW